jgi:hypothetical protein
MSDTSSESSEPGRRNDADYPPLPHPALAELFQLRRGFERLSRNLSARESRQARLAASTIQSRPGNSVLPGPPPPAVAQFTIAPVPGTVNYMERQLEKPVMTVVSALPSTTYKEENDSGSGSNTLAYVKVQRALLKYAEKHALDSLSPHQARVWTQAIDPAGKNTPKAADALRLCYYMRSQGYDVYSRVRDNCVHLCLMNQGFSIRDKDHDALYWKQSVKTNHVDFYYPSPSRAPRRNAVSDLTYRVSGIRMPSRPATRPAAQGGGTTSVALRQAEAHLQIEIEREPGNPE